MPAKKKTELTEDASLPTQKKRERKSTKHQVVAKVSQDGIQGSFKPEIRRPLIVHLPIHSNDVKFYDQPLQYDPNPPGVPVAYEDSMTNPFMEINETEEEKNVVTPTTQLTQSAQLTQATQAAQVAQVKQANTVVYPQNEYGPTTLLVQFGGSKDTKELPIRSDVACFWCCETFESRPCVIPTVINDGVWSVYGNFCTPHCASAYILSDLLDTHVRWERLALLHRLYAAYCGGRIYPSPKREVLERFGGPMKSQDFRKMCEDRKIRADVHLPPMVSILASMDTKPVDFYETSMRNVTAAYVPVQNVDSGLKLKRSKPLKDRESTLDSCLNITVR
jgi:hypothetical protein